MLVGRAARLMAFSHRVFVRSMNGSGHLCQMQTHVPEEFHRRLHRRLKLGPPFVIVKDRASRVDDVAECDEQCDRLTPRCF